MELNPLRSKDGEQLLKDSESITSRWKEHYHDLLNQCSTVSDDVFDQIPQRPLRDELSTEPTMSEVTKAISQLKNKATGPDGIPAEVFKAGGLLLTHELLLLLTKIWQNEEISTDLRDALIVTIFKKGDKSDCGNYRGISLLSIAGKILARILTNRLQPIAESQCGFRSLRGTVDMIFSARQLQEKCREQNRPLYMAFIDLTKAFDTVNRHALWMTLAKIGCPEKYINILKLLHDNMRATVLSNNATESEPFSVSTGVKQGCVIAPTLFSIYISSILHLTQGSCQQASRLCTKLTANYFA